jgi:prepilin-type N-terminal cleavage/methylation domain-containing protein
VLSESDACGYYSAHTVMREPFDRRAAERGFTVVELLVALAITAAALLGVMALRGGTPPERRTAAIALQGALAETRALAASQANVTGKTPTGATLSVVPVGANATRVSIFASRPIAGAPPLAPDTGFAPLTLPVTLAIPGSAPAGTPFAILVSSAGYASVAAGYAYDPARPMPLASDPGCDETHGVTIAIVDAAGTDAHAFECRTAAYDADTSLPSPAP